jgi:hypothetical protein
MVLLFVSIAFFIGPPVATKKTNPVYFSIPCKASSVYSPVPITKKERMHFYTIWQLLYHAHPTFGQKLKKSTVVVFQDETISGIGKRPFILVNCTLDANEFADFQRA